MSDDVDPDEPRPDGYYHVDRDADRFYVDDELASTIALGPATDGEPGDDWVLTVSAAMPAASQQLPSALVSVSLRGRYTSSTPRRRISRRTPVRLAIVPSVDCAENRFLSLRRGLTTERSPVTRTATLGVFGAPPWYDGQ
ncbi:hypothetical protein [Halorubrum sp. FL23]|uniref:hypothetical protein n=1 Tax=Halorubrum sp. FL23 TaxID=3458704 RepID=UPI004034D95E